MPMCKQEKNGKPGLGKAENKIYKKTTKVGTTAAKVYKSVKKTGRGK